jgi:hypothetical protein
MDSRRVALNQTDVSIRVRILDDADGTPALGLSDSPVSDFTIWYQRGVDGTPVTETSGVSVLGSIGAAHTDWGIIEVEEGWYRLDIPDAAFVDGVEDVLCGVYSTGYTGVSVTVVIDPFIKFQGQASAATSTTTTFASADGLPVPFYKGDYIYVVQGIGIGQTRMIQSMSGLVATHAAWDVNISTSSSTLVILPGDETIADGILNCDVATSTRSTLNAATVATEAAGALTDISLDKLLAGAVSGSDVVDDSVIAQLVSSSGIADWDDYDNTNESLSAINTAIAALNDITASDVWADTLGSTGLSASAILQIIGGVATGKLSGADTTSITIRNIQDTGDLVVATVDGDGNRSSITINTPGT